MAHRIGRHEAVGKALRRLVAADLAAAQSLSTAARLLAEPRDADVAAASARGLREIAAPGEDAGLDRVVAELDRKAEEAHHHAAPVRQVGERLEAAEAALGRLPHDLDGTTLFERALARSYRKGR